MADALSQAAKTITLMSRWRLLMGEDRLRLKELRAGAQRCFRLAESAASFQSAAELEAIGRDFARDADRLSAGMQAAAYQICYSGFARRKEAKSLLLQQLTGSRLV